MECSPIGIGGLGKKEEGKVLQKAKEWIGHSVALAAQVDSKIVGVTGMVPGHEKGEATFLCIMVLL